jgi:hypothetical protein
VGAVVNDNVKGDPSLRLNEPVYVIEVGLVAEVRVNARLLFKLRIKLYIDAVDLGMGK